MPSPDDKKIQIDETVKNELVANAEKQRKLRDALIDEMAQERAQQRAIDARAKREDHDIKAAGHWDNVNKWVSENVVIKGAHGYIEYSTAMMDLCAGYALLNKAMAYDNMFERGMKFVWAHTLEDTKAGQVLEGIAQMPEHLIDKAGDKILRGVGARKSPVLEYSVHIDEDGKLTTTVTKNGEPLPNDQQMLFDTGLVAWLTVRGGEFDPATQIAKDEDGNIMTPEKLAEMSQDDENGLTAFFEGKMDVEITQAPKP